MAVGYQELLVLLGLLLVGALGITGLVLFIIGVAGRKTAMWVSGLVMGIVAMTTAVGGVVFAVFAVRRVMVQTMSTQLATISAVPVPPSTTMSLSSTDMRVHFLAATSLDLPEGCSLLGGMSITSIDSWDATDAELPLTRTYMKISTPETFEAFLKEHFDEAAWSDVSEHMTSEEATELLFWDDVAEGWWRTSYRPKPNGTTATAPLSPETYISYHRSAKIAHVVIVQKLSTTEPFFVEPIEDRVLPTPAE